MSSTSPTLCLDFHGDDAREAAPSVESEALLVRRAVADPAAFTEIYRLHYPTIGAYLFRRSGDVHATEDMLAEVFLAALKALPKFRAGEVPLRFWLYRIATNVANMRWRELARRTETAGGGADLELVARGDEPHAVLELAESRASAQRALLALQAELQAVLSLFYFQDLSVEDIARVLEIPAGTVKSRLSRARDAFTLALQRRRSS